MFKGIRRVTQEKRRFLSLWNYSKLTTINNQLSTILNQYPMLINKAIRN